MDAATKVSIGSNGEGFSKILTSWLARGAATVSPDRFARNSIG
jgi:hypothetical protein